MRKHLGGVVLAAMGVGGAGAAIFGATQVSTGEHAAKPLPAAVSEGQPHSVKEVSDVAALAMQKKDGAQGAVREKEIGHLQSTSLEVARTIIGDLRKDPNTILYNQTMVGVFPPAGTANPEMYAQYYPKSSELVAASINMPTSQTFNNVEVDFKVSPGTAAHLDKTAQQRPLTVSDFKLAVHNPDNVSFESAKVETPASVLERKLSVDQETGAVTEVSLNGQSTLATEANVASISDDFASRLEHTSDVLHESFEHNN